MERVYDGLKRRGTDLNSDRSEELRYAKRPTQRSPGRGKAFEDFGSGFNGSSQPSSSQTKGSKPKRTTRQTYDDESDDELDCLSQSSSRPASRSPSARPTRLTSRASSRLPDTSSARAPISRNAWEPGYQQPSLSHLKFKKNKNDGGEKLEAVIEISESPERQPGAGTSKSAAREEASPVRPKSTGLSHPTPRASYIANSLNKEKERRLAHNLRHLKRELSNSPASSQERATTKQATRTPSRVDPSSDEERTQASTPRPTKRPQPRPVTTESRMRDAMESRRARMTADPDARDARKGKGKEIARKVKIPEPQPFPLSPPNRSPSTPGDERARECPIDEMSPLKPKSDKRARCPIDSLSPPRMTNPKGKAKKADKDPISKLSPLNTPERPRKGRSKKPPEPKEFPMMSPLSSQRGDQDIGRVSQSSKSNQAKVRRKSSGRALPSSSDGSDESDDGLASSPLRSMKPRPFPMETQILASIGRSSKRASSSSDDDIEMRRAKNRRGDESDWVDELLRSDDLSDIEDDSIFLDPSVDPKTLCPWCDERLPPAPTPHLLDLMHIARSKSSRDARPSNPLGLRAPLTAYTNVCQRHRFESVQAPRAQREGWPTEIPWGQLPVRVEALRDHLQAIVDDVDEDFVPGGARMDAEDDEHRPRKHSEFWQYVRKSVKEHGSRKAAGIREQLGNFSKTQPGYYGELGYMVINQTIYNMFPPASFDPDSVLPLTPTNFIQLILVPEVAVSLIMEDMDQTREEAIATLHASAEYGVAMFPDDHVEGIDAVDTGDQIVKDRALARRKVLQEEDRLDGEMFEVQGSAEGHKAQKRKPRPKKTSQGSTVGSETDNLYRFKSLRRTASRSSRRSHFTETSTESDGDNGDDYVPPAKRGSRKKTASVSSRAGSKTPLAVPTPETETINRQAKSRPKPRPVVSEARSSQSQGRDTGKEKENAPSASESDQSDAYRIPPSNQQAYRRPPQLEDDETTPRPTKTSRSSSVTSTTAMVGTGRKVFLPLQAARERNARKQSQLDEPKERYGSRDKRNDSDRGSRLNEARSSRHSDDSKWLLSDSPSSSQ